MNFFRGCFWFIKNTTYGDLEAGFKAIRISDTLSAFKEENIQAFDNSLKDYKNEDLPSGVFNHMLHEATVRGNIDFVKYLVLSKRVNLDDLHESAIRCECLLSTALSRDHEDLAIWLFEQSEHIFLSKYHQYDALRISSEEQPQVIIRIEKVIANVLRYQHLKFLKIIAKKVNFRELSQQREFIPILLSESYTNEFSFQKFLQMLQLLLDCGIDVNDPNHSGFTPLEKSLDGRIPNPFIVRKLLENGANPSECCEYLNIPFNTNDLSSNLFFSVMTEIIYLLWQYGAGPYHRWKQQADLAVGKIPFFTQAVSLRTLCIRTVHRFRIPTKGLPPSIFIFPNEQKVQKQYENRLNKRK